MCSIFDYSQDSYRSSYILLTPEGLPHYRRKGLSIWGNIFWINEHLAIECYYKCFDNQVVSPEKCARWEYVVSRSLATFLSTSKVDFTSRSYEPGMPPVDTVAEPYTLLLTCSSQLAQVVNQPKPYHKPLCGPASHNRLISQNSAPSQQD